MLHDSYQKHLSDHFLCIRMYSGEQYKTTHGTDQKLNQTSPLWTVTPVEQNGSATNCAQAEMC